MKNKMRMIKAAIGVKCASCFVGPLATFLASPATLYLLENPGSLTGVDLKGVLVMLVQHFADQYP